ncbi:MAG TPA: hypothetical protein VMH04_22800 [Candidatus Solibacter sp.]|nr:hypothetical protein [Candidatus Solibacter sp.]
MLRLLYRTQLALHPPAFRKRFADEMLSIFDRPGEWSAKLQLLADGFLSLVRQWALRPEFWYEHSSAIPTQPASDGIPSFFVLDSFRPRPSALIHGLVVSMAVFCLTCFAIRYSSIHILHLHIPRVLWEEQSSIQPSVSPSELRGKVESPGKAGSLPTPAPAIPAAISSHSPSAVQAKASATVLAMDGTKPQSQITAGSSGLVTVTAIQQSQTQLYAGVYICHSPDVTIAITTDHGSLMMKVGGQPKRALAPVSSTRCLIVDVEDSWIEFDRDNTGTIRRLRFFQDGRLLTAERR